MTDDEAWSQLDHHLDGLDEAIRSAQMAATGATIHHINGCCHTLVMIRSARDRQRDPLDNPVRLARQAREARCLLRLLTVGVSPREAKRRSLVED